MGCCQPILQEQQGVVDLSKPEDEFNDISLSSSPKNKVRAATTLHSRCEIETSFIIPSPSQADTIHRPTRSLGEFSKHLLKLNRVSSGSDPTLSDDLQLSQEIINYCVPASVQELDFSESEVSVSVVSVLELNDV